MSHECVSKGMYRFVVVIVGIGRYRFELLGKVIEKGEAKVEDLLFTEVINVSSILKFKSWCDLSIRGLFFQKRLGQGRWMSQLSNQLVTCETCVRGSIA